MDQAVSPIGPETNNQDTSQSDEAEQQFMNGAVRRAKALVKAKAAPVVAAGLIAGGTVAAVELNRSAGPEVKADVPYQQYGHNGYPTPELITSKSQDPIVEEIKTVPSNNPFEIAQQLLWVAANTDPHKVTLLKAWHGVIEVSGVTFYHAPVGSTHFMPFNPNNNGEADKLVVQPDEVAFIKNPVKLVTYTDEPDLIIATLASNPATKNTATKIEGVYMVSLDEAEQKQAKFLAPEGSSSTGGYATVPEGDASINSDGNFQFGTMRAGEISRIVIVNKGSPEEKEAVRGMVPASPPSNH